MDSSALLDKTLVALKLAQEKIEVLKRGNREPIAIVGASCRFPGGADSLDSFWELLTNGVDPISEIPAERWDVNKYYSSNRDEPDKMYVREAGFLQNIDLFDPLFFEISPQEAFSLDPQHRLLLEVSWEALEIAGIPASTLKNYLGGVFVGLYTTNYKDQIRKSVQTMPYISTGNYFSTACGRLSYFFGMQGPSMAIEAACASSLVAVHEACRNLQNQDCHIALAGGVNVILGPEETIDLCKAKMLSPDGRCKTFDAGANGFARSEGCGMVVLKRLSDAIRDNDPIMAVIKGSAVNHDGSGAGLTVPNSRAQRALITAALREANVEPSEIDYVETHGTGTSLGDPIEVEALDVFSPGRSQPLLLGAVKSNIGHTETAAGIASLIKLVLCLQKGVIPKNLHFTQLNPVIKLDVIPAEVVVTNRPWKKEGSVRRGGVSSFGLGGTNAHVIVEEAPQRQKPVNPLQRPLYLFTLSAKKEKVLGDLVDSYILHLKMHPEQDIGDITYTTNAGRTHFKKARLSVIVANQLELISALEKGAYQKVTDCPAKGEPLAFVIGDEAEQAVQNLKSWGILPTYVVKQADELNQVMAQGCKLFLEMGKFSETYELPKDCVRLSMGLGDDWMSILKILETLYLKGFEIDWKSFDAPYHRQKQVLPTYRFQRKKYWFETSEKSDVKQPKVEVL